VHHCRQIGHWAHRDAGGQCADATEAGDDVDRPTNMHMGTGSRGLGQAKDIDRAGLAGRMARWL